MDIAIDKINKIVYANNANHGIYFCTECGELSFLRKPYNRNPYFYHVRYNEKCSLSVKGTDQQEIINSIIENNFRILQGGYSKRWIEAIDSLYEHNCLFRLYGKEWAISPINMYINSHIENIDPYLFYEFLHILSGINSVKSFKLLLSYFDFSIMNNENKEFIERDIYNQCNFSNEILYYVINEEGIDIFVKFKIFCQLKNTKKDIFLKDDRYQLFKDIEYVLERDNIERYEYFYEKYLLDNCFKKMILYEINRVRNSPENKIYRSINKIKNNYYDNLYNYLYEV